MSAMQPETSWQTIRHFLPYLKPHRLGYLITGFLTAVSAVVELTAPLVLMILIDHIIPSGDRGHLAWFGVGLIGLYLLRSGVDFSRGRLLIVIQEKVVRAIQEKVYQHVQNLPLTSFDTKKTGYLTNRVFNDAQQLSTLSGDTFISILINACIALGTVFVVFTLNWELTLVSISVVPVFAFIVHYFNRYIRSLSKDVQEEQSKVYGEIQENFAGIRVIKAYGLERERGAKVGNAITRNMRLSIKLGTLNVINRSLVLACTTVAGVSLLWFGSTRVMSGSLTIGELMAFSAYVVNIYGPIRNLMGINLSIQAALGSADRIIELLEEKPAVIDETSKVRPDLVGQVTYQDVSFHYGDRLPDGQSPVLDEIDITFRAGETIALVGRSGAGKTTFLNLLMRFYEPKKGLITIDGYPLGELHSSVLTSRIANVAQDDFLFSDTIEQNIAYGRLGATEDDIREAAVSANAHDFIMSLPDGYDTIVGERGHGISGGERQRISIARAFLKNPKILILDEATSSVDSVSERLIKESLERLREGRTTFIIAHRFSTVLDSDRILVLDEGRIAGVGTHPELYGKNTCYTTLYDEQLSGIQQNMVTHYQQDGLTEIIVEQGPKNKRIVTVHV